MGAMRLTKVPAALFSVLAVLAVLATPASAATGVVAAAKPWHYWVSFVLVASVLGLFFMMGLGYVVKVTMAKYGIKVGRRAG
jgi:hypothetical protein